MRGWSENKREADHDHDSSFLRVQLLNQSHEGCQKVQESPKFTGNILHMSKVAEELTFVLFSITKFEDLWCSCVSLKYVRKQKLFHSPQFGRLVLDFVNFFDILSLNGSPKIVEYWPNKLLSCLIERLVYLTI